MDIAWITPGVHVCGAVREMCEVSNALARRGHSITIYHPTGAACTWLPCRAKTAKLDELPAARPDILIGLTDWQPELHAALDEAKAGARCVCIVGFDPNDRQAQKWRGEVDQPTVASKLQYHAIHAYHVLTDSSWQVRWLQERIDITALPPFGGVNLRQFHPVRVERPHGVTTVIATGDPRQRKGLEVVTAAVQRLQHAGLRLRFETYWGHNVAQADMAAWYSRGDIFLDAERRAGWANPVAEAMACGVACVTTNIPAVTDFAVDGQTALLVPVDDSVAMCNTALELAVNHDLRKRLAAAGLERIKQFDYDRVVIPLEKALQEIA